MALVMTPTKLALSIDTAKLELEYERAVRQAERIYEEEAMRVLRVQMLLLEDEHEEAKEQVLEGAEQTQQVRDEEKNLQQKVANLEKQYQQAQSELRSCLRDMEKYQAEIEIQKSRPSHTPKHLTEKLALTRELDNIKPELEHLRLQVAMNNKVLAEKLTIQRELGLAQTELDDQRKTNAILRKQASSIDPGLSAELDALKQQLADEKNAVSKLKKQQAKKASEKSTADAALVDEVEELKQQLEETKKSAEKAKKAAQQSTNASATEEITMLKQELDQAKRTTQKYKTEQLQLNTKHEQQKEVLETKLEAFRSKLRSTKDQLKEAQEELDKRENQKFAEATAQTQAKLAGRHQSREPEVVNGRKRPLARFDPDMTIGTPGHGGLSKRTKTSLNIADKSTLSITPFLNRTMSVLPESSQVDDEHEKVDSSLKSHIDDISRGLTKSIKDSKQKPTVSEAGKSKRGRPAKDTSKAVAPAKRNTLAQVLEEDEEEPATKPQAVAVDAVVQSIETTAIPASSQPVTQGEFLVKKKKLLNKDTIFEDNGLRSRAGSIGLGKIRLGMSKNKSRILDEFSPLKRDRRAMSVQPV